MTMNNVIYNNIIPFKGYKAIALWPFVFVRASCKGKISDTDINHESIHLKQQAELLLVVFYLWYGIEWLIRWLCYGFDNKRAYHNICFEQEAYDNDKNLSYLSTRKCFSWFEYLVKKKISMQNLASVK